MILKQLQRLTLSATTRRNANVVRFARFYGSPAVCESLTTTKAKQKLSRDDRRDLVVSFVNKYRAANDGKFPTCGVTRNAVGGGYKIVKDILEELNSKPKQPLPIVAKALLEESASVPIDASSLALKDTQSHVSAESMEGNYLVTTAVQDKRETQTAPNTDVDSKCDLFESQVLIEECSEISKTGEEKNLNHLGGQEPKAEAASSTDHRALVEAFVNEYRAANDGEFPTYTATWGALGGSYHNVKVILQELKLKSEAHLPIIAKAISEESVSVPNDASSQTMTDTDTDPQSPFSATVVDPGLQANDIESGGDLKQAAIDSSLPDSDETNLQDNNLAANAPHGERETETNPNTDVDSKCDLFESQLLVKECSENPEAGEQKILSHLDGQESNADPLDGAAISENIEPTVTRQVLEKGVAVVKTEEKSSAWSSVMSFAKDFVSFWRKG